MRALCYPEFGTLDIRNVPEPQPAAGEVLLKVSACGLCGSELETFLTKNPRRQPPLIMGHEFCGTIVDVGPGGDRSRIGHAVVSNSVNSCGTCVRCRRGDGHLCAARQVFGMHRAGAFAELVAVPTAGLIEWPESIPATSASLAEPLANGIHVVNLTKHLSPKTVLVIGAGPIGLMCQQAAQVLLGARVCVADLNADRLKVAESLKAWRIIHSGSEDPVAVVRELTEGEGVDLVIDAVGAEGTKTQSLAALRPGGATVWIGLHANTMNLATYDITLPEKQVFGTYAAKREELEQALVLMQRPDVDVHSWVEQVHLDQSVEAFHRMAAAKGTDIKAVIIPNP
jgi:threonine dehydrogenase-like Zn-dependent dehydrogenase